MDLKPPCHMWCRPAAHRLVPGAPQDGGTEERARRTHNCAQYSSTEPSPKAMRMKLGFRENTLDTDEAHDDESDTDSTGDAVPQDSHALPMRRRFYI